MVAVETESAFEVRTKDCVFRIWADGRTEGFEEIAGDGPCIVFNRIPHLRRRLGVDESFEIIGWSDFDNAKGKWRALDLWLPDIKIAHTVACLIEGDDVAAAETECREGAALWAGFKRGAANDAPTE